MFKSKVDEILQEYQDKLAERDNRVIGAPFDKTKPLNAGGAIDLAFQAIESMNKRLKALEKKKLPSDIAPEEQ